MWCVSLLFPVVVCNVDNGYFVLESGNDLMRYSMPIYGPRARFPPFGLYPKWFFFLVIHDGSVLLSDSARVCLSLCVAFSLARMKISSFSLGMVVNECRPSKVVDVVVCGLLVWQEPVLALEVCLLELFSHSNRVMVFRGYKQVNSPLLDLIRPSFGIDTDHPYSFDSSVALFRKPLVQSHSGQCLDLGTQIPYGFGLQMWKPFTGRIWLLKSINL